MARCAALLIAVVVATVKLLGAEAWWDEGHMLVAAVAELVLTDSLILGRDDAEYATREQPTIYVRPTLAHEGSNLSSRSRQANEWNKKAQPTTTVGNRFPWKAADGAQTVKLVNDILSAWAADYMQFSTLISSAVWADHIKCNKRSSFCPSHWQRFDGIEIFNQNHFVSLTVNSTQPPRPPVSLALDAAFRRPGNAAWMLRQVSQTLSTKLGILNAAEDQVQDLKVSDQELFESGSLQLAKAVRSVIKTSQRDLPSVSSPMDENGARKPNRHDVDFSTIDQMSDVELEGFVQELSSDRGTRFSYNLMMRLFIHVFGDIYQPLHATVRVDPRCFPFGDQGGNEVVIHLDPSYLPTSAGDDSFIPQNLHQLWDSAAGLFYRSYPAFSIDEAWQKAHELIKRHPPPVDPMTGKYSGFDPTMRKYFLSSVNITKSIVYREVEQLSECPSRQHPYAPSEEYIAELRNVAFQRITYAGYNLAYFLRLFTENVPPAIRVPVPLVNPVVLEQELMEWKYRTFFAWGFLGAIGLVFGFWRLGQGFWFEDTKAVRSRRLYSDDLPSSLMSNVSVTVVDAEAHVLSGDLHSPLLQAGAHLSCDRHPSCLWHGHHGQDQAETAPHFYSLLDALRQNANADASPLRSIDGAAGDSVSNGVNILQATSNLTAAEVVAICENTPIVTSPDRQTIHSQFCSSNGLDAAACNKTVMSGGTTRASPSSGSGRHDTLGVSRWPNLFSASPLGAYHMSVYSDEGLDSDLDGDETLRDTASDRQASIYWQDRHQGQAAVLWSYGGEKRASPGAESQEIIKKSPSHSTSANDGASSGSASPGRKILQQGDLRAPP